MKRVFVKKIQKSEIKPSTSTTGEGGSTSFEKAGKYDFVEVCPNDTVPHLFKIWQFNTTSMAILIGEDSSLMPHLHEGDRLEIIYHPFPSAYPGERLETVIKQISRDEQGGYKGHFLLDLAIVQ